jgi:regulator of RNase E activity RraA
MGELSAETLKKRNVSGYLVDGGCRDVSKIESLQFPVFCSFNSPKDVVGRWIPKKLGESITIGDCQITTGDYILADSDGAVIIPKADVVNIVHMAETVLSTENAVRSAIMAGIDPAEAYLTYGKF